MRPRILLTNWVHAEVIERLATVGEVVANPCREPWARADILARAEDADAMIAFMSDHVDAAFLGACRRLRIIACALKGFDNFDIAACARAGIWVSFVPDLLTEPTAELAVGLVIALGRHLRAGDALVRSGSFTGWRPILYGVGLHQSTVAIVGVGALGRAIAARLLSFGCTLLGVDVCAELPAGMIACSLPEALDRSEIVILAVPLATRTRHLIDTAALQRMKPGALLINVGRGSVVDEAAVAEALAKGRLGGYAADVFAMEDWALGNRPTAIDPRLLAAPRTVFTPHLGSAVDRVRRSIALRAADNVLDVLAGRPPRDAVNQPAVAPPGRS